VYRYPPQISPHFAVAARGLLHHAASLWLAGDDTLSRKARTLHRRAQRLDALSTSTGEHSFLTLYPNC
jgi:hypothetical protein